MNKKKLTDNELKNCVGGLSLETGVINDKNGTNIVDAPAQAVPGAFTAFGNIITKGPGLLANVDLIV